MFPRLGVAEIIISCLLGLVGLSLPVAILVFLYTTYNEVNKSGLMQFAKWRRK